MKALLCGLVVFMLAAAAGVPRAAPPANAGADDDPVAVVRAAGEALAAGDKEAWVASWSEDAVVTDVGSTSSAFVGRGVMPFLFDATTALHTEMEELSIEADGNTVTSTGAWTDDTSRAAGVTRYLTMSTVVVSGGTMSRYDLRYDTSDAQTNTYLEYVEAQPAVEVPGASVVTLAAASSGGQAGTASLADVGGATLVTIDIAPGAADELQPADVQQGACPAGGATVTPLAAVLNGASLTILSTPLSELQSGGQSLHVSNASGASVTCGDLQAPAPATPVAPAPSPAPATPPPSGVVAPNTGGGPAGGGDEFAIIALALVLGAGACGAAALAVRKRA